MTGILIDGKKSVQTASFAFSPGKACAIGFDKVVYEILFGRPEKLARMIFINSISPLESILVSWCKG
jgi:hypothetical protein